MHLPLCKWILHVQNNTSINQILKIPGRCGFLAPWTTSSPELTWKNKMWTGIGPWVTAGSPERASLSLRKSAPEPPIPDFTRIRSPFLAVVQFPPVKVVLEEVDVAVGVLKRCTHRWWCRWPVFNDRTRISRCVNVWLSIRIQPPIGIS